MSEDDTYADMPLTAILKKWMDQKGWVDEINIDDARQNAQVATRLTVENQPHRLYFDADEQARQFSLTLYTPFNVPTTRMSDVALILNRINCRLRIGHFACWDDDEPNPIRFRIAIDAEGGTLGAGQIETMLNMAGSTLADHSEILAVLALTKQPADIVWRDFRDVPRTERLEGENGKRRLH